MRRNVISLVCSSQRVALKYSPESDVIVRNLPLYVNIYNFVYNTTQADVSYESGGLEAVVFVAEGDMRNALNALQSTVSGLERVTAENVFKVMILQSITITNNHTRPGHSFTSSSVVKTPRPFLSVVISLYVRCIVTQVCDSPHPHKVRTALNL